MTSMTSMMKTGARYFAIVFAIGFVLGTIRTLMVVPVIGEVWAVCAEVPLMLFFSWRANRYIRRSMSGSSSSSHRKADDIAFSLGYGLIGLILLLLAEAGLALTLANQTLSSHLRSYQDLHHAIGLAAQIAFGLFPYIQARYRY